MRTENSVFPLKPKFMINPTSQKPLPKKIKTQVIGVRLPVQVWNTFEIRCIENNLTMSDVLRQSVGDFLKDTEVNDKLILT